MNHAHPGVALGPIGPIGVVAAPGPGGNPVGIGIGVPLMSASTMVPQICPQLPPHHQKKLVSPDSSDDKEKYVTQIFSHRSSPPGSIPNFVTSSANGNNPLTWGNPLLQSVSGMRYPIMGMSVMGPSGPHGLTDPGILYGLIGAATGNAPDINLCNHSGNITTQSNMSIPITSSTPAMPPNIMTNPNGSSSPNGPVEGQSLHPAKDIIHCKSCTLFPPNPSAPPPTTREKPPGCRTVFVGGLPENVTDEIIREIFDRCGEITTTRMSKKNFCHIRFELENSVDTATCLSGYRIRIGSNSDPPNIGRLHVDYAQARDDLYEWECRQRQLLREQRHRERIQQERLLPPSPPSTEHYSDHEASTVAEKIKSDDAFVKGIRILSVWLDRGDCVKRNSNSFYSMIQSTNSHVRRLLNEKSQYEDELQKAKELMRQRMTGLLMQFSHIEKVFVSACQKKAWDHFSKAQRKNIEMWRKQASEIKNVLLEEALAERHDEEMELSDSSDAENDRQSDTENRSPPASKKSRIEDKERKAVNQLKEENDALRCQLEASNNEVDLIKADLRAELESKDMQLRILQQQLTEMQKSVTNQTQLNHYDRDRSIREKSCSSSTSNSPLNGDKSIKESADTCDSSSTGVTHAQANHSYSGANNPSYTDNLRNVASNDSMVITEREARLIGVMSTFLHVHPFGASLDYIWSYTQKVLPSVRPNELESVLAKFKTIFKQEVSGVGASLERKWIFIGFSEA